MGRLFLEEFEETPLSKFYICKLCKTHIALAEDCRQMILDCEGYGEGVFNKFVNVYEDERGKHRQPGTPTDVYCVKCGGRLGWKYFEVGAGQYMTQRTKFTLSKLLKRVGNQILDPLTGTPVPKSP